MRPRFFLQVLLPLIGVDAYLFVDRHFASRHFDLIYSEFGIVELATAFGFGLAGTLAFSMALKSRNVVATPIRAFYLCVAVSGWFVALEEISYGQHLFSWSTPDWFRENNAQREMNLHNLFDDRLSDMLRGMGNFGFPFFFAVGPCIVEWTRRGFSARRWSFLVLPRFELVGTVLTAEGLSIADRIFEVLFGDGVFTRRGEVQELYFAVAVVAYVRIIHARVEQARTASASASIGRVEAWGELERKAA